MSYLTLLETFSSLDLSPSAITLLIAIVIIILVIRVISAIIKFILIFWVLALFIYFFLPYEDIKNCYDIYISSQATIEEAPELCTKYFEYWKTKIFQ